MTGNRVELDAAVAVLPLTYAVALRLEAHGDGVDTIAAALDLAPELVPALLEIGRRKLVSVLEGG